LNSDFNGNVSRTRAPWRKSIEPTRKKPICGAIERFFLQDFSTCSTEAPSQSQDIAYEQAARALILQAQPMFGMTATPLAETIGAIMLAQTCVAVLIRMRRAAME
jgi:hypothetical protein